MIVPPPAPSRQLKREQLHCDLAVIGGGLAGTCCAITAARQGLRVVLVQDRPVLGGNASSEVRLWTLGATAHMGNNNRWARETGVIDEILVENMWRNPEGNALIFDTILLETVTAEPNITLLLNTAAYEVSKSDEKTISGVRAFCSQNSTQYDITAPLFADASGDGIVGFLAGAAFRMGAESADEFGEKFAPSREYGELLGHSMYFYTRDTGRPVKFIPPAFALRDVEGKIPRFRSFNTKDHGCRLWWIEWGGRLDTVHDTETIKWELWKVVYGVWDYLKNSGKFPDAENLTLEWVSHIPGKRESRRFEGDYILTQQDVIEGRRHPDDIGHGGWGVDLHPADGVFSEYPGCTHWQAKSIYPIPYRCLYSRNIDNLFIIGRIASSSHVAFGTTRVMATCSVGGQAVAVAARLCREQNLLPRDLSISPRIEQLQQELLKTGQYIPHVRLQDPADLARSATITASSELRIGRLAPSDQVAPLPLAERSAGQMLPVSPGAMPQVTVYLDIDQPTVLQAELRVSSRPSGHTPDTTLATRELRLDPGQAVPVTLAFDATIDQPRYAWVCLMRNEHIRVRRTDLRITGVLAVKHGHSQHPTGDIGIDAFEFWTPWRRPDGQNFAIDVAPPIVCFGPDNVTNGVTRPVNQPNAWVADPADPTPTLTLAWDRAQSIRRIVLTFDVDLDHPMESVLMGHPERAMPFCVKRYRVCDAAGNVLAACDDNHQRINEIKLPEPAVTDRLVIQLLETHGRAPASLFEVRCYA